MNNIIKESFNNLLEELDLLNEEMSKKTKHRLKLAAAGTLAVGGMVGMGAVMRRSAMKDVKRRMEAVQKGWEQIPTHTSGGRQPGGLDDVLGRVNNEIPIKATPVEPIKSVVNNAKPNKQKPSKNSHHR